MDNSVFLIDTQTGAGTPLTARTPDDFAPRPEACVFAPDGRTIAYIRRVKMGNEMFNQIFTVAVE